jgi:hypothetical protein
LSKAAGDADPCRRLVELLDQLAELLLAESLHAVPKNCTLIGGVKAILICAHWGRRVESYDQFLSWNLSAGNTNYTILLAPDHIERIPRSFNFLIFGDPVGDTQKYMRE